MSGGLNVRPSDVLKDPFCQPTEAASIESVGRRSLSAQLSWEATGGCFGQLDSKQGNDKVELRASERRQSTATAFPVSMIGSARKPGLYVG